MRIFKFAILFVCHFIAAAVESCHCPSDYFLVVLVNARHLDYSCPKALFRTIAKHPSDGSKNGDVGHAWIYLQGKIGDLPVYIEGGHSGERGVRQARYFDGVMNYIECGYANPTKNQLMCPRYEPNPIKYLWASQCDGFFQEGSGSHRPTFAAKVDITQEQFLEILRYIQEYDYDDYAITRNQCSSFVVQAAALAGLELECDVTVPIDQEIVVAGERLQLWQDPRYAWITFSSPDVIECSLKQAVKEGCAEDALRWYLKTHPVSLSRKLCELKNDVCQFPARFRRAQLFK